MPSPSWERVEALFAEAIELPPERRAAWLDDACAGAPTLRAEVESLLANSPEAGSLFGARVRSAMAGTAEALFDDLDAEVIGQRVGPYRILSLLGEGGMGQVFLAERDDGQYRGQVALKVLQHTAASREIIARFRDERQILASLQHPAIVRLLDGGTTARGLPYLVMEHIAGVPLERHARTLSVRERVTLMRRVCEPLEYAHQRLVVHRDIKPSNVLVTAEGAPKLLDFGIAKLIEPTAAAGREARTRTGVALLTPEYASPEQARGDIVSVASDVYSLGAVLYHVLCGRPPHVVSDDDVLDTLRGIIERDPPRPSTIAAPADRRAVAGDLDNIAMRALQKDPARRYPSIAALSDDLARWLDGRPVVARDATLAYRVRKFVGRNRGVLALGVAVFAALLVATIVSIGQAERATAAAAEAERQTRTLLVEQGRQALAKGSSGPALAYLAEALRRGEDTAAVRFMAAEAMRPFERELARVHDFPKNLAAAVPVPRPPAVAQAPLGDDDDAFVACGHDGRVALYDRRGRARRVLTLPGDPPSSFIECAFDARGERLFAQSRDGDLRAWERATGRVAWTLARGHGPFDNQWSNLFLRFEVVGRRGAERLVSSRNTRFEILDAEGGAVLLSLPAMFGATTRDGEHLYAQTEHALTEHDVHTGAARRVLWDRRGRADAACDTKDATMLSDRASARVFTTCGHVARAYDVADGRLLGEAVTADGIWTLVLSPDERVFATGGNAGGLRVFDASTFQLLHTLPQPSGALNVGAIAFAPSGTRLLSTTSDNVLRVFDLAAQRVAVVQPVTIVAGTGENAHAVLRGSQWLDERTVLSHLGADALVWEPGDDTLLRSYPAPGHVYAGAVAPDRRRAVIVGAGFVALHDLAESARGEPLQAPATALWAAAWSVHDQVAVVGDGAHALLYDLRGAGGGAPTSAAEPMPLVGHEGNLYAVAFTPDGAVVATGGSDGVRLWDVATRSEIVRLGAGDRVMSLAFSRDGAALLGACYEGALRVWDVASRRATTNVDAPGLRFLSARFTADERGLIGAARQGIAAIWERESGARGLVFEGHGAQVTWADDSADGALMATVSVDQTLRVWDAATGLELGHRTHTSELLEAEWLGDAVITYGNGAVSHLWSARRAAGDVAALDAFLRARVPWRFAKGRAQRVEAPDPR